MCLAFELVCRVFGERIGFSIHLGTIMAINRFICVHVYRLPSAYLQDGFGVEWPNSERVLSTLYARGRRGSERRTTGLLADSASSSSR